MALIPGSFEDADYTAKYAQEQNVNWLVIDGYHFSEKYQSQIGQHHLRRLVLDDNHEQTGYDCDFLLNQNIHSKKIDYILLNKETRLLLGSRYALIRKEF